MVSVSVARGFGCLLKAEGLVLVDHRTELATDTGKLDTKRGYVKQKAVLGKAEISKSKAEMLTD